MWHGMAKASKQPCELFYLFNAQPFYHINLLKLVYFIYSSLSKISLSFHIEVVAVEYLF